MTEIELETRRKRWEFVTKTILLLILGCVVAPFIFMAIKGMLGIVLGFSIAAGLNFFSPLIAMKVANWRIKMIKAEAAKNPIETLQLDYADKMGQLMKFKESIEKFGAACMTFKDKLDGFKTKFPDDADKFDDQLDKMQQLLALRKGKYKDATQSLKQYDNEIDRARAIWDMGQEAAKMNAAAGMTEEDFLSKIKVETALDSVTTSMNTAFSELETSLEAEKDEKGMLKLTEGVKGQVIEEQGHVKAPAKVRRS